MSTRALIGKQNDDGSTDVIYLHWDGYPEAPGAGATLQAHYASDEAVTALMEQGDCSSLGDTLDECDFYRRDKGESGPRLDAKRLATPALFRKYTQDSWAEHAYVWNGQRWDHTKI